MGQFEAYSLLFTDILVSNLIFIGTTDIAFGSMQIFGNYNRWLIILVAIFGYMLSTGINYLFGIVCYKILAPTSINKAHLFNNNKYLPLILALSCIPFFGKFIVLFAGFCKVRFRTVFFIATSSKLAYYAIISFY